MGNAVARNRAKRVIRQAYRENEINMPIGIDMIIVARSSACRIKSDVLSGYLKNKGINEIKAAAFGEKINEIYFLWVLLKSIRKLFLHFSRPAVNITLLARPMLLKH